MTDDFDFSIFEVGKDKTEEVTLKGLMEAAERLQELSEHIEDLNESLGELNKEFIFFSQKVIPDMMAELGMNTFELKDGSKISVKEFMSGSLPKEPELFDQAIEWLIDNDLSSILKTDVTLKFNKGEENFAKNAVALLEEQGYDPEEKFGVHPQTLYAAIRELQRDEVDIPYELLGLYAGKRAEIKLKKEKK